MADCIRCRISGLVQGVFFRASARNKALELGISGWVRNLPDGSVEVLSCGDDAALEAMQAWLRRGPPMAEVTDVDCVAEADTGEHDEFEVR